MLAAFQKNLLSVVPDAKHEKFLLAVSGGVDSMVMAELFIASGYNMGIAHCNFGLRGKESDGDEAFVNDFAKKHKVPFHVKRFNTAQVAKKKKLSIQMAARELRYAWLAETSLKHRYSSISIAHNSDDVIETFFINLLRGTGIAGLHGIASSYENIIRPLLSFSRQEILDYASSVKLKWREDSSNASDKYERNKIRHHLIPLLEKINPNARKAIHHTIENIKGAENIYKEALAKHFKELLQVKSGKTHLSISALKKLSSPDIYIYEAIKDKGFNFIQAKEIAASLNKQSGKVFLSKDHRITRDRNYLILEVIPHKTKQEYKVEQKTKLLSIDTFDIDFSKDDIPKDFKPPVSPLTACLDHSRLKFPLTIRKWQKGDKFYPLGMDKPKKVSDFLVDKKVSLADKEHIYVLVSSEEIAWIIGHRIDNRFKIVPTTKKLYICNIEYIPLP